MTVATPHIVHLLGNLSVGGIASLIQQIASHPACRATRQSVIVIKGIHPEVAETFRARGIAVHACPIRPRVAVPSYRLSRWLGQQMEMTFAWRLAQTLKRVGAHIVHTHSFSSQEIDSQARAVQSAGLPWVWSVHGFYEIPAQEIEKWRKAHEIAKHGALRITADSMYLANLVKTDALIGADVDVVYPGTDTSAFGQSGREAGWRDRNRIPASAVLFGSTGRLVHVKGFDLLLRAAEELTRAGRDFHVVVAGAGELMDELQSQVSQRGLTGRVQFLGFQEALPSYLSQLDVFVLSSRSEGFPVSLLEALASGLPCIAARVGGVPEMLGRGLVVPPEDAGALAQAMESLLDSQARESLASHSREIVARYSMDRCAQEFKSIYDSLLR